MSERRLHAFDLDDTLIPGSLVERAFWKLVETGYIVLTDEQLGSLTAAQAEHVLPNGRLGNDSGDYIASIVKATIDGTRGLPLRVIQHAAQEVAEEDALRVFPEMQERINTIKDEGDSVAIISGSIDHFVHPLARRLGARLSSGSRFYVAGGEIHRWREHQDRTKNKDKIMLAMCRNIGAVAYAAYGDSISDLPMLVAAQNPYAVNPQPKLRAAAKENNWPVIDCK